MRSFFFDTYAMLEIGEKNPGYSEYVSDIKIITTRLNLMELYYILLRKYGKEAAEEGFGKFVHFAADVDDDTMKEAMQFRFANKERKLSYVDCVGYMIAAKANALFLTGDMQFEDMSNVEFVK